MASRPPHGLAPTSHPDFPYAAGWRSGARFRPPFGILRAGLLPDSMSFTTLATRIRRRPSTLRHSNRPAWIKRHTLAWDQDVASQHCVTLQVYRSRNGMDGLVSLIRGYS